MNVVVTIYNLGEVIWYRDETVPLSFGVVISFTDGCDEGRLLNCKLQQKNDTQIFSFKYMWSFFKLLRKYLCAYLNAFTTWCGSLLLIILVFANLSKKFFQIYTNTSHGLWISYPLQEMCSVSFDLLQRKEWKLLHPVPSIFLYYNKWLADKLPQSLLEVLI